MTRFVSLAAALVALVTGAAGAAEPAVTAVPPLLPPPAAAKSAAARLLLPQAAAAASVTLPEPTDAELAAFRRLNAKEKAGLQPNARSKRLAIGFAREVPAAEQMIDLAALDWRDAGDGMRAARIEVRSPGAAALRVAIGRGSALPGVTLRFSGTGDAAKTFGPYSRAEAQQAIDRFGAFWSPLLKGDTAVIELALPAAAKPAGKLVLPKVSHAVVPPGELGALSLPVRKAIGDALSCEIDVKCVQPASAAFTQAVTAVAKITFNDPSGNTFSCSGTVLNDSANDGVPYFFTANHCIESAYEAATINTYWFFEALACGTNAVRPDWVQHASGAKLLARSPDWDWALVQLNQAPPPGVVFSAWRAEAVASGTGLTVLHHPSGDLKKFSAGTANGFVADGLYNGVTPASFVLMTYTQGETEGGSSGSGLLTFNPAGYYEVRGGLYNGLNADCPRPANYFDVYSRLDNLLPLVREHLTPGANPAGTVTAVEFYNPGLDHYFVSTAAAEIRDLDTGVHPGWVRTGIRFNAYATQVPGTSPVCRFYRAPAYGDSHFYSASPAECAQTAAAHPVDWIYESPAVFYVALPEPVSGTCPAGTRPLWRFFNQLTTNHRYTPEVKLRDEMRDDPVTWVPEGYGPDAVIMCSPIGG
jgi:hypothetical protein